jgi:VanZ family protein
VPSPEEKNLPPPSHRIKTQPFCDLHLSRPAITVLCLFTLCATLVAGLWPFHSPTNDVLWVENENALRFGDHGTALSSRAFGFGGYDGPPCSLEVWLEPDRTWTTGSVLAFYGSPDNRQFSMQQDFRDLVLQHGVRGPDHETGQTQMRVEDVFRRRQAFITVTSNGQSTAIYLDGHLAKNSIGFELSLSDLGGQLILANSPLRGHSWPGQLRGLAIYGSELSPEQVVQHYEDWTQRQEPTLVKHERALALYLFNERGGKIIRSAIGPGNDLDIPSHYLVVNQLLLEPPWQEFSTQQDYLKNCIINIAGFVPLGFFFSLYFAAACKMKRASLAAIVLGGAVSLVIEVCQAYLPTRYSGMTDIITNTLGTGVGVALYGAGAALLTRLPMLSYWDRRTGSAWQ